MSLFVRPKSRAYQQASHSNVVTSVAFSPRGGTLASGSWDGTVKLWDVSVGRPKLIRTYRGEWDEVEAVAFAPDGSAVAAAGTGFDKAPFGVIKLWPLNTTTGRTLVRQAGKIDAIAFAPDGSTLASGSGDRRDVSIWDVASGREQANLPGHQGPIRSVAFAPDGRMLAVASGVVPAVAGLDFEGPLGEVCTWDLSGRTPAPRARLVGHEYGVVAVAFSPGGRYLASGGFDRCVKLWGVETGRERSKFIGHNGWVATVAFSPDSTILATGSHDQTIKLWDVDTGQELATLDGHTGNVYSVAFSPDGLRLASGSLDGTVRLWDVEHALITGSARIETK